MEAQHFVFRWVAAIALCLVCAPHDLALHVAGVLMIRRALGEKQHKNDGVEHQEDQVSTNKTAYYHPGEVAVYTAGTSEDHAELLHEGADCEFQRGISDCSTALASGRGSSRGSMTSATLDGLVPMNNDGVVLLQNDAGRPGAGKVLIQHGSCGGERDTSLVHHQPAACTVKATLVSRAGLLHRRKASRTPPQLQDLDGTSVTVSPESEDAGAGSLYRPTISVSRNQSCNSLAGQGGSNSSLVELAAAGCTMTIDGWPHKTPRAPREHNNYKAWP